MNPLAGKTWREVIVQYPTWAEFRDAVLDRNPLEIVNLPNYRQLYNTVTCVYEPDDFVPESEDFQ